MSKPRPFTVIKDGCHYEIKVDAHYVSDEELQTLRRYIATLNDENAKLRTLVAELVSTTVKCQNGECTECRFGNPTGFGCTWYAHMRELGIEVDE